MQSWCRRSIRGYGAPRPCRLPNASARRSAPYGEDCFAERAREKARESDVVVTNHALLTIGALESIPVLPEYDAVVVDEAHELADQATNAATVELSPAVLERVARRARRLLGVEVADALEDAAAGLGHRH